MQKYRLQAASRLVRILLPCIGLACLLIILPHALTSRGPVSADPAQPTEAPLPASAPALKPSHAFLNKMMPAAMPAAPTVTATKSAAFSTPGGDVNNNGLFDPGDTIKYSVVVSASGMDATSVSFSDTLDNNTTLVGGSFAASPVAVDDTYPQTVIGNVSINSANIPYSVVTNDFLGVNPTATITAFDATSAQGGNVSMTTSGAGIGQFTYNPPAGFTGTDTFT